MIVIETNQPGFKRGRLLEKIGLQAQDTAELFFEDVRAPVGNLLGKEGAGFGIRLETPVGPLTLDFARAMPWAIKYNADHVTPQPGETCSYLPLGLCASLSVRSY